MTRKELRIAMIQANINNAGLAEALGISKGALQYKLNGKREFKESELRKMIDILHLSPRDFMNIFFA